MMMSPMMATTLMAENQNSASPYHLTPKKLMAQMVTRNCRPQDQVGQKEDRGEVRGEIRRRGTHDGDVDGDVGRRVPVLDHDGRGGDFGRKGDAIRVPITILWVSTGAK